MLRAKISVPTKVFSRDIRRAIQAAMELGVGGVRVDLRGELLPVDYGETARRQLLHYLSERGLQLASGDFPLRNPLTSSEHLDERLAAIRNAIDFAARLKIRTLTLRAGRLPPQEDTDAVSTLHSILSELAARGNQNGVELCLVPCGEPASEWRSLLESITAGPVRVDADPAIWTMNQQAVTVQLRELHDLVGHFEIRDAIGAADGRGREVPLGRGEVDWDEVAALIGEMGYNGWLNVDRTEGADLPGDIRRGVQYLRNLLPGYE